MKANVLLAVFKRNFVSYFASPLGYLFICGFVLLSTFATFWPHEFFNANLANLAQLNKFYPFIMLFFVPAITMSIWADERRQGTDELLLTIPAADFEIVLGKYLAAVSIFTVSLLFSLLCNYSVLRFLGRPDAGLFIGTYVGYWLVGVGMLAVGMVASFLTGNLTVAYLLGAAFNAPLVFATMADVIFGDEAAMVVRQWAVADQFRDFGRGMISLSGLVYFLGMAAVMLYLSVILIGRRHWRSGDKHSVGTLLLARLIGFVVILAVLSGAVLLIRNVAFSGGDTLAAAQAVKETADGAEKSAAVHAASPVGWILGGATLVVLSAILTLVVLPGKIGRGAGDSRVAYMSFMPAHSTVRVIAAVVIAASVAFFFQSHNLRCDVTSQQLSSLSTETVKLLAEINRVKEEDLGVRLEKADGGVRVVSVFGGSAAEKAGVKAADVLVSLADEKVTDLDGVKTVLGRLKPSQTVSLVVRRDGKESTLEAALPKAKVVEIEAFISPKVPENYVQTRMNLVTLLEEFQARSRRNVAVRIYDTEQFSDAAGRAEKRFGITARQIRTTNRGAYTEDRLYLGVALTCGLQKVILPFIDRGTPAEYELIRSVMTVTQQKRRRVGILQTDAQLYGRFNMQTMSSSGNWPIIEELQKSYDVTQVDAASPIKPYDAKDPEHFDVLLAVQPSTLSPEQMTNFVTAVKAGQPTAIFEDPFPYFAGGVPGTADPRRPAGGGMGGMAGMMGGMGGGGGPQPKGEIRELWTALGIDFSGVHVDSRKNRAVADVVYQTYNPYRKIGDFPAEFVFVDRGSGTKTPFSGKDAISSQLQQILFPFPGFITQLNTASLEFEPLARTAETNTGTVATDDIISQDMPFGPSEMNPERRKRPQNRSYVLAAHIRGKLPPSQPMADEGKSGDAKADAKAAAKPEKKPENGEVNVVLVADIDMLTRPFFQLREQGDIPELGVHFDFDNVTFVLNVLDELAGDQRFIEIRKRRPMHRTLERVDQVTADSRQRALDERERLQKDFDKKKQEIEEDLKKKVADLQKRLDGEGMNTLEAMHRVSTVQKEGEQRNQVVLEQARQEMQRQDSRIQTDLNRQKRHVEERYKMWSVVLPPIPPLAVACFVFLLRGMREREGVSRKRLRK